MQTQRPHSGMHYIGFINSYEHIVHANTAPPLWYALNRIYKLIRTHSACKHTVPTLVCTISDLYTHTNTQCMKTHRPHSGMHYIGFENSYEHTVHANTPPPLWSALYRIYKLIRTHSACKHTAPTLVCTISDL